LALSAHRAAASAPRAAPVAQARASALALSGSENRKSNPTAATLA
jgi:hypothetical protein